MNVSERQLSTTPHGEAWLPLGVRRATVVNGREGEPVVTFLPAGEVYPLAQVASPEDLVSGAAGGPRPGATVLLLGRSRRWPRREPSEQALAHALARLGGPVLVLHPPELRRAALRLASRAADRGVLLGLCAGEEDLQASLALVQRFVESGPGHRRPGPQAFVIQRVETPPAA